MNVIYADVLVFYNFIIDLFLLYVTAKIIKAVVNFRIILSALIGAVYSFFSLFFIVSLFPVRLFVLYFMIIICFKGRFKEHLKAMGMFLVVSFILCGVLLSLNLMIGKGYSVIDGYPIFLSGNILLITSVTLTFFFCVTGIKYAIKKYALSDMYKMVKITFNKKTVTLNALVDTGNNVYDYLNNRPVIFVNKEFIEYEGCKIHTIDISTLNGGSRVLCITPKSVEIDGKVYKATIGISNERIYDYDAILGTEMFLGGRICSKQ